jgi:hypothetical protein
MLWRSLECDIFFNESTTNQFKRDLLKSIKEKPFDSFAVDRSELQSFGGQDGNKGHVFDG